MAVWKIHKEHKGLGKLINKVITWLVLSILDVILDEERFSYMVRGIARQEIISRLAGNDTPVVANVEVRGGEINIEKDFGTIQNSVFVDRTGL